MSNKKMAKNLRYTKPQKHYSFLPAIIQLILSIIVGAYLFIADMIPEKYLICVILILGLLSVLTFCLTFTKKKSNFVISVILSIVVSALSLLGIYSLATITGLLGSISNHGYEVSNMAVVVKADDSAEDILDTDEHVFSVQTFTGENNNELMISEIEKLLGSTIEVKSYANMINQASGFLENENDAMIINEAFIPVIEETLDEFANSYKIIYTYGIEVETTPSPTPTPKVDGKDEIIENLSISEKPFNIYISGIDTTGKISNTSRSDVNIIMSVDPVNKEIVLITTPRDFYVTFPDVTGSSYDKLTHAGIYGIDVSIATLEQLYDTKIDYYAKVNFTSLVTIIDALDGVDVYSEYSFHASSADYYFKKGMNTLNGKEALAFSRERYAFSDGDNQRGKNQQQVIVGILNKVTSPSVLSGITEIINSVSDNVQTNMNSSEMSELIKMQLDDASTWNIETISAEGICSSKKCYSLGGQYASVMIPDQSSVDGIKEILADISN